MGQPSRNIGGHVAIALFLVPLSFLQMPQPLGAAGVPPHIIHILADDFGWADWGHHRNTSVHHRNTDVSTERQGQPDVSTPNLDELVKTGIELSRFYVYKICSPSRSAIQTGRNPIHVNVQNVLPEVTNPKDPIGTRCVCARISPHPTRTPPHAHAPLQQSSLRVDMLSEQLCVCARISPHPGGFQGIPTNMTGIASVLKRSKYQYRTHIVGKWDIGMATEMHHPRARGYETWLGYWHHANDYWTHTVDYCGTASVFDLWEYNATQDGPAQRLQNGPHCSQANQTPAGERCVYEEDVRPTTECGLIFFMLDFRRVFPPALKVLGAKHVSNPELDL